MNTKAFYEVQAAHFQAGGYVDGRIRKASALLRRHLGRARRLLDIGCGVGIVGAYLAEELGVQEVCGVEIAEKRAAIARSRGLRVVLCDLNHAPLPFRDDEFDAIFCGEVIEHLLDPDGLLDEVHRVLHPSGVCVLTTPNLASWHNRLALLFGWQPFYMSASFRHDVGKPRWLVQDFKVLDHLRLFTRGALEELLKVHDFRVLETRGTTLLEGLPKDVRTRRAIVTKVISPVDAVLGRFPSLSVRLIVAFTKA